MTTEEQSPLQSLELYAQREIGRQVAVLEFIHANRDILEKAHLRPSLWSNYLDYDCCKRPDVLRLLKVYGGKWDKQPSYEQGHLTYVRREQVGGRVVRISGEPPASCRIVETVKYVKVPAKRERIVTRRVVCK